MHCAVCGTYYTGDTDALICFRDTKMCVFAKEKKKMTPFLWLKACRKLHITEAVVGGQNRRVTLVFVKVDIRSLFGLTGMGIPTFLGIPIIKR